MRLFLLNLLLAVLWTMMWGSFSGYMLLSGLLVGYLLLGLLGRSTGSSGYGTRLWRIVAFAGYFVRILILANWQVARVVTAWRPSLHPRVLRYPVEGLSPVRLTVLANAITLTPGTVAMDVSADGRWLYVHCLNAPDRGAMIRELDELRDRLMRGVFT